MPSAQQRRRVRQNAQRVVAPLREAGRSAKTQTDVRGMDLGTTDRAGQIIPKMKAGRVEQSGGVEDDRKAVHPKPRLVDERGTEDVGFIEGQHLAVRLAMIAESGYGRGGVLEGGFLSLIHISEPTRQAEISYAVF